MKDENYTLYYLLNFGGRGGGGGTKKEYKLINVDEKRKTKQSPNKQELRGYFKPSATTWILKSCRNTTHRPNFPLDPLLPPPHPSVPPSNPSPPPSACPQPHPFPILVLIFVVVRLLVEGVLRFIVNRQENGWGVGERRHP